MKNLEDLDRRILDAILGALPTTSDVPELERFAELQRDYPRRGGKGIRGRLVVLSAIAHGGTIDDALPVAAALELFQNWVLVHDDVEDDSETRRGTPALHRMVGTPVAINVGDAMHVAMWQLLIRAQIPHREAVLNEFVDTITRTAEGQHLDLTWVEDGTFDIGEADYIDMVERKTARYTVVSPLRLGALLQGLTPDERFERAGLDLGAAFQIRDDVLNLLPDDGAYGKEFAGDLYEGKRTLILAHALQTLSKADGQHLIDLLSQPRPVMKEAHIQEALELIDATGAITYAQGVAETKAERGLALLSDALESVPNPAGAASLLTLLETLANRKA